MMKAFWLVVVLLIVLCKGDYDVGHEERLVLRYANTIRHKEKKFRKATKIIEKNKI